MAAIPYETLVLTAHFFLSAILLAGVWFVLAAGLAKLLRLESPVARMLIFIVPVVAAFGARVRLSADATFEIIGVCVSVALAWFLADLYRYRRFTAAIMPNLRRSPALQAVVDELAPRFGLARPPAAYELSGAGAGPCVIGLRRPRLIMPRGICALMDADEMCALVAHELAHVARRDAGWKWLWLFLRRLAFLNPIAAWAHRRIGLETERACDLLAVQVTGKPGTLARTLVKMEERLAQSPPLAPLFAMANVPRADSHLAVRIASIASGTEGLHDSKWMTGLKLLAIFSVFSALCLRPGALLLTLIN